MYTYNTFSSVQDYELASLKDRIFAQIIDYVIAGLIVIVASLPLLVGEILGIASIGTAFFLAFMYLLFSDGLSGGQSLGKKAMRIAVVNADSGEPCGFIGSALRNLSLNFLGIIDWIFIVGDRRQRLGDMIANTRVVKVDEFY